MADIVSKLGHIHKASDVSSVHIEIMVKEEMKRETIRYVESKMRREGRKGEDERTLHLYVKMS